MRKSLWEDEKCFYCDSIASVSVVVLFSISCNACAASIGFFGLLGNPGLVWNTKKRKAPIKMIDALA